MTDARRLQIESVCAAALAVESAEREVVLARQCGDDAELRREVESLLAAASQAEGFLEAPAWQEAGAELADLAGEGSDAAPAVLLPAGTRLGPYEIAAPIGAGGMGEVYRARDTRLGRSVAVKVLPPARAGDADRRRRFHHEARAASALHHPNICAIYDVGDAVPTVPGSAEPAAGAPSVTFLVMELLEGETLAERLARGRLPLAQALEIAAQVAAALGTAHKAGIVHRDVKPGNVMLTKPSAANSGGVHATLLDFGLAKLRAHGERPLVDAVSTAESGSAPVTARGMILGTLPYMAPEQVEGKEADARTDIWALGAVIYEMVAGARAFVAATPASLIAAILEREPEPLTAREPLTPPSLYRVVRKCLAKDPDGRWDSAHDVADELRWIAQDSGEKVVPATARRTQRRRLAALGAAAVVLAAVAAGAWSLIRPLLRPGLPEAESTQITSGPYNDIEPAVSPDGNIVAYVVDDGHEQSIWLVPTRGGSATPWTRKPGRHRRPAWSPDGRIFFESSEGDWRGIFAGYAIDGETARPVIRGGSHPAVSRDGKRLAFVRTEPSGHSRVVVTDLADPSRETVLTMDDDGLWDHIHPAWSPQGDRISYGAADGLWVVPADGRGRARRVVEEGYVAQSGWSDSGYIYFSAPREGGDWALWRVTDRGSAPQRVDAGVGPEQMPSLSFDGKWLVFSITRTRSELVLREIASGHETPLGGEGAFGLPTFAFDGGSVFFLLDAYSRSELWTQALVAGRPEGAMRPFPLQRPVDPPMTCSQVAPSPDGRWVAFLGKRGDKRDVYVTTAAGGVPLDVSECPEAADYHPAWSPDSSQLAFVSERDGEQHVWVRRMQKGMPAGPARRLTTSKEFELWPTWSPDGSRVAFMTGSGDRSELAETDAALAGMPRILTSGADSFRVKWSARSGWLLTTNRMSGERFVLRAFDPVRRAYVETFHDIDLGTDIGSVWFDISPDERHLALVRQHHEGRIGVMNTQSGRY